MKLLRCKPSLATGQGLRIRAPGLAFVHSKAWHSPQSHAIVRARGGVVNRSWMEAATFCGRWILARDVRCVLVLAASNAQPPRVGLARDVRCVLVLAASDGG